MAGPDRRVVRPMANEAGTWVSGERGAALAAESKGMRVDSVPA